MRGYDIVLLRDAVEQIRAVANATGVDFSGPVMLPTRRKVFCVLRSPHVDKDAREHFEVRTHHRLIDLKNLSSQAVEAMMQVNGRSTGKTDPPQCGQREGRKDDQTYRYIYPIPCIHTLQWLAIKNQAHGLHRFTGIPFDLDWIPPWS